MPFSYVAINRMVEEQAMNDEDYRRQLKSNGRCTLSDGRSLSDEILADKLRSLAVPGFNRNWLDQWSRKVPSAQFLSEVILEKQGQNVPEGQEDWVWIALVCLWERWFPDRPNFEMLDDWMQDGYVAQESGQSLETVRQWSRVWDGFQHLIRKFQISSIEALDDGFDGTYSVFTWVQDFSLALHCAALDDLAFAQQRLVLCQTVLELASKSKRDRALIDPFRTDLAETLATLAQFEDASREQTATLGENDDELDLIVAELDEKYTGKLPKKAIRAAQIRREEITPRLIELIRGAVELVRTGHAVERNGHLFALYLLTEFEAKEALPVIVEAISLPEDAPFDLFGDVITEDLCRVLAVLAVDTPDVVDELIANRAINQYVRWATAKTYIHWVRDERMTRLQAVEKLRQHLHDARMVGDSDSVASLISVLTSFAPQEALDEIEAAYHQNLVDERIVRLHDVEQSIAEGESYVRRELENYYPTGIVDTVTELSKWASFQEANTSTGRPPQPPQTDFGTSTLDIEMRRVGEPNAAESLESVGTIRGEPSKIGRNAPCPCGSGRKYKKCCGAR